MSEEDDKAEIYSILSEPFSDEDEESNEDRKYAGEERGLRASSYDLFSEPSSRSRVDEIRGPQNVPGDQMSLDFEMPDSWPDGQRGEPSPKSSLSRGGLCQTHQRDCLGTIEEFMKMVQKLIQEKIASKSENDSLQARVKDVLSQLDKQLVRREADQKKIIGLLMRQQRVKEPPQKIPESSLVCDVQKVDTFTALGNGFDNPTIKKDSVDQLTRDPADKAGEPPTQQYLLGVWDPDVQIVSIGFELPEWVTIRLTNNQKNSPLIKTGYLIHHRVLENITTNVKDLTGSLSVLEAAFANNESLLQKEKELRLETQIQVEELLSDLQTREEQVEWLRSDLRKRDQQVDELQNNLRKKAGAGGCDIRGCSGRKGICNRTTKFDRGLRESRIRPH
jgi:hypothetical protein